MSRSKRCAAVALAAAFTWTAAAQAGGEAEVRACMQQAIDRATGVLGDPELRGDAKKQERRGKVRDILLETTDMYRISLLTLGRHRSKFSPAQLDTFAGVFSRLVFVTYITHLEKYQGEEVSIKAVEIRGDGKAQVQTRILYQGKEIPTGFSLFRDDEGQWRIYDVQVEGVSLVHNYRTQFHELLIRKSPDELIAHLKQKVEENEEVI